MTAISSMIDQFLGPKGMLSEKLPGYEFREAQRTMATEVLEAMDQERHLLVEAGTGTGKTLAYLVPAALAGRRVVVSTGTKALQDQLIAKDVPMLRKMFGDQINVAVLKGRQNYFCHHRAGRFAFQPDFFNSAETKLWEEVVEWSTVTKTGDRAEMPDLPDDYRTWAQLSASSENCLGSKCPHYDECFYFKQKDIAWKADIIIGNHALYLADAAVRRDAGVSASILPQHDIAVFDEAHMLEDMATSYLGLTISNYRILDLVTDIRKECAYKKISLGSNIGKLSEALLKHNDRFFSLFLGDSGSRHVLPREWWGAEQIKLAGEVLHTLHNLRRALDEMDEAKVRDRFQERCSRLANVLTFIAEPDEDGADEFVFFYEPLKSGAALHAAPINVADSLREHVFEHLNTAVLTSATLTAGKSFSFVKDRVGLDDSNETVLESPFDYPNQALLYIPRKMVPPEDPGFPRAVADEVERIVTLSNGRALVLFTSFRVMNIVHRSLRNRLPYKVLCQGERPKHMLLDDFRADTSSVLFATASFWQGIDVRGEALSAVIIDKIPFAVPGDPVVSARIDLLKRDNRNAFMEYQVPSAVLTLKQGLGRLIRSTTDTGILALLDNRIHSRRYGSIFLRSFPPCNLVTDYESLARQAPNYF